jgi:hypothetical protein
MGRCGRSAMKSNFPRGQGGTSGGFLSGNRFASHCLCDGKDFFSGDLNVAA